MTIRSNIEKYAKNQKIGEMVSGHKEFYIGVAVGAAAALIFVKRQHTVNVINIMRRD